MYKQNSKRNFSLDIARVFALCCVMMIHCSSLFVTKYPANSFGFWVGNVFDSLSRIGVPIFVMISGALLLDESKTKSFRDMLKNVCRTFLLIAIWSVIYSVAFDVVAPLIHGEAIDLTDFVKSVITGQVHMWYLYMLIGLYIATPFLRSFVKKENKGKVLFYIAVSLIFVFFRPIISTLGLFSDKLLLANTLLDKFHTEFFAGYTAYYLTGWYVVHIGISKSLKKLLYGIAAVSVALIIITINLTGDHENIYSYTNILVYLYSLGAFTAITALQVKKLPSPIALLSRLSFGMYIVHILINKPATYLLLDLNPLVHIILRFIIVFALSFAISFVLSKIPIIKKIVRV